MAWEDEWERMSLDQLQKLLRGLEKHAEVCSGCQQTRGGEVERLRRLIEQREKEAGNGSGDDGAIKTVLEGGLR